MINGIQLPMQRLEKTVSSCLLAAEFFKLAHLWGSKFLGLGVAGARLHGVSLLLWAVCALAHAAPADEQADSILSVRVVDREQGRPIAAATVECQAKPLMGEDQVTSSITAAADGGCTVSYSHRLLSSVTLRATAPGHAAIEYRWILREGQASPSGDVELKIPQSVRVGGVVRNRASDPVPQAQMQLTGPCYEQQGNALVIERAFATTGPDGKWQTDVAANSIAKLNASIEHPEYAHWWNGRRQLLEDALRNQTWEAVLEDGVTVKGRVIGPQGQPLAGAAVRKDQRPPVRTDREGRFSIAHCPAEELFILHAQADGFAATQLEVLPLPQMKPVEVSLSQGHNFTVCVVDGQQRPVSGAMVRPTRWMKKTLQHASVGWSGVTATDGCATWSNAPDGELAWLVAAPGYRRQELTFAPKSGKHTIALQRLLHIRGEVVDAETGKKVEQFQVVVGSVSPSGKVSWPKEGAPETGSNGRFEIKPGARAEVAAKCLLILSPHHLPCVSGVIPAESDEVTTRLALVPATQGVGRVLDSTGSAVSSASLCLLTPWSIATDLGQGPIAFGAYPIFHTESDGSFTVPPQDSPFALAAWTDAGYAEQQFASTTAPLELRLAPWASCEGELREFEPGERVEARALTGSAISWLPTTAVDSRGRFTFPKLRLGKWSINAGTGKWLPSFNYRFEARIPLEPGVRQSLRFGDGPRVVTGSIDLKTSDGEITDFTGDAITLISFDRTWVHRTPVAKDGTFRFQGVPAGRYGLSLLSNTSKPELERRMLADGVKDVVVPDDAGTSTSQVNVGRLQQVPAQLFSGLSAAEIKTISPEGREIHLSDFRGRWVVVDFWSKGCGPCIRAMKNTLKPMWQHYRNGGRLVIYSVALTEDPPACIKVIQENNFDWIHGFVKGEPYEVFSAYQINGVPALYLIDPQGVVVAADVEEAELVKKVTELVK